MSSNPMLGYFDMVLAVSTDVINQQFNDLQCQGIIARNWNIIITEDPDENVNAVRSNQTPEAFDQQIQRQDFAYAFNAQLNPPAISVSDNERKIVILTLSFESGTLYLWNGHGPASVPVQVDMKGWCYAFNVDIGLTEKKASQISWITQPSKEQYQQFLSSAGLPDDIFNVKTLFLDFDNVNYADYDATKSVITSDLLTVKIFQNLLSNYFKSITCTSNPYIISYGFTPANDAVQSASLFQPTDLKYSTTYSEDSTLNAFNFLMMTDGNTPPSSAEAGILPQNLLTQPGLGRFEIDRGAFSAVISRLISPSLQTLCLIPAVKFSVNFIKASAFISYSHENSPQSYAYLAGVGDKVLTFSYSSASHDSDTFIPNWGNITNTITVSSDVFLADDIIRIVTTATCFLHLNIDGGVSEGNIVNYTSEIKYQIAVGDNGALTVTQLPSSFTDNSAFNKSTWSEILSFGRVDNMINSVRDFWAVMRNFMGNQENCISNVLNSSHCWAFPGGRIFQYDSVKFSATHDLCADTRYLN